MHKLSEIGALFLKLGCIAFGGPAAHIAMMEEEVVTKRKWMTKEYFLDLVGATNLIPGPNSTEMAIHCGYHRAGFVGLLVAGISFILPATLITGVFAWIYLYYGTLPQMEHFIYGIRPAVLVIILSAVYKLGQKALKNWQLGFIGICVIMAVLSGVNEITSILAGGILGMFLLFFSQKTNLKNISFFSLLTLTTGSGMSNIPLLMTASTGVILNFSIWKLFLVFLKIGAVLFGSGYVLVAYLQGELVDKLGWLTQQQLLDAIAVGQFTPGPVLSTATFIGYQIYGIPGAIVATVGIFLPSFFFVAISNPIIPKLRKSKWTSYFLDAVNISSIAIMLAVTIILGKNILVDWKTIFISILGVIIIFYWKNINSVWIVIGSAIVGYLLTFF